MLCNVNSFQGRGGAPLKASLMQRGKRRRMRKLDNKATARNRPQKPSKTKKIVKTVDSVVGPGKTAPNLPLNSTPDQQVALHDLRRHPVILALYPAAWSPACTAPVSSCALARPASSTIT